MAKTYVRAGSVVAMTCPASGEAAPTTSTDDGMPVNGLEAITVTLSAEATRTLSATGDLACYILDDSEGGPGAVWMRFPAFDIDLTTAAVSGVQHCGLHTFELAAPRRGRVLWLPVTVGISAGTNVTVYMFGQVKNGVY